MPDRRVHVEHSVRMASLLGLGVPWEAHVLVQRLIDEPRRVPRLWWRSAAEKCPGLAERLLGFLESGLRARGVLAHDWRSRRGRELLYGLVECLYGEDARLLVDLHFALDALWEGRDLGDVDGRVRWYLERSGLLSAEPGAGASSGSACA